MAKEVDLKKKVVAQTPSAPVKPNKPDPSGLRIPPPTQPPGRQIPLAPGQVLHGPGSKNPALTPMELAALTKIGWKPGDPVPSSIPPEVIEIAQQIHDEALVPTPPIDPNSPRTVLEVVDVSQVSPEKRAEVDRVLKDAAAFMRAQRAAPATPPVARKAPAAPPPSEEDVTVASQAIPGWKPPNDPGYQPAIPTYPDLRKKRPEPPAPPPAEEPSDPMAAMGIDLDRLGDGDELVVELPTSRDEQPKVREEAAGEAEAPAPSAVGATAPVTECPHCGWSLELPDIPEPDYGEKQAFLQSILGQKSFIKEYDLLGGALKVRFRTLNVREIDIIYRQVFLERERGVVQTIDDYWERTNRYRLYLQTCQLTSASFHHDLPDGYDAETSPHAEAHWKFDPPEDPRETGLPIIESYFVDCILTTEHLNRAINNQCLRFNRLVAKLEAMIDNSDFWRPTEALS